MSTGPAFAVFEAAAAVGSAALRKACSSAGAHTRRSVGFTSQRTGVAGPRGAVTVAFWLSVPGGRSTSLAAILESWAPR